MAKGTVNKVILIGRLGADPEVRYTAGGSAIVNLSIATNEMWKDKQTGESQERTEWNRVVFFGRLAEIVGEYLKKGSRVYVEGSLRTRKWQDKSGNDRYTTEVAADEMQMLDGRGEGGGGRDDFDQSPPPRQSGGGGQSQNRGAPPADDFDDEIPF